VFLVALEKLQSQCFELVGHGVDIEGGENHGPGATGHHVADLLVRHRRESSGHAHGLGYGDEVGRGVEQRPVHVE